MKPADNKIFPTLLGCLLLLWVFCSSEISGAAQNPLEVFVSIPPQAYLAETVGGQHVRVHILAEKGQDPHTFEPTPKQIITLGQADFFFITGLPFENRLVGKIMDSKQKLTVVDISKGITKRMMAANHHDAGPEESETPHGGEPDPHLWLAPPLLKIMAQNIAQALMKAAPKHALDFRQNLAAFENDVDVLHARIKKILHPFTGQAFYVYHPAFGYFGDTYALHQRAVELEGKTPTPKHLSQLISQANAEKVKIIFVQPQFDKTSAATIAKAINGAVVEIDSLAYDVLKNLEKTAFRIERSFSAEPLSQKSEH